LCCIKFIAPGLGWKGEGEEGGGEVRGRGCACGTWERSDNGEIDVAARMSSLLEPDGGERESFNSESL
jgi:hypothetical protein